MRPRPAKHMLVRDVLAGRIAHGELRPGDRLPSVRAIAAEQRVSVTTASEAVQLLAAEQLVKVLGRRRGTVVAGPGERATVGSSRLVFSPQERFDWTGPVPGEVTEVVAGQTGMADARGPLGYVAAILRLEGHPRHGVVPVFRRTQLVRDPDGVPVRLEVSWFDAAWSGRVEDSDGGHPLASQVVPVASFGGAARLIAAHSHRPVVAGSHGVEARGAKDDGREGARPGGEPALMSLAAGTPLLAGVYDWQVADPATGELAIIEYGEYVEKQGRVVQFRYQVSASS